jgi:hypothetical protein
VSRGHTATPRRSCGPNHSATLGNSSTDRIHCYLLVTAEQVSWAQETRFPHISSAVIFLITFPERMFGLPTDTASSCLLMCCAVLISLSPFLYFFMAFFLSSFLRFSLFCYLLSRSGKGPSLNNKCSVRFHVLTVATMKITAFWDLARYSPVEVARRFWGASIIVYNCRSRSVDVSRQNWCWHF